VSKHGTLLSVTRDQTGDTPRIVTEENALPDYDLAHAVRVIADTYGHNVSVYNKAKDLLKFGHSHRIGTSFATIAHQPVGIDHESYVTDNLITHVISTSPADTGPIMTEYHTVDGNGNFTFGVQTSTLLGQHPVALDVPAARVSRGYNNGSTDFVGEISWTEVDTYTNGVPDTDTTVHMQIEAGENQTEKAATTISNNDYWIVTNIYCDFLEKSAGFAEVALQIRNKGKVFRNKIRLGCSNGYRGVHAFKPFLIVPANSDVRLVASANAASTDVSGGIEGYLAIVI
jgi:hypothetical protein